MESVSPNDDSSKPDLKRDREFWFVAIVFWGIIAPIFLYGFARAFLMPAELLASWMNTAPRVSELLDFGFAGLGFAFAVYAVIDIWKRLRIGLANRTGQGDR
jgi:hypothetical protein